MKDLPDSERAESPFITHYFLFDARAPRLFRISGCFCQMLEVRALDGRCAGGARTPAASVNERGLWGCGAAVMVLCGPDALARGAGLQDPAASRGARRRNSYTNTPRAPLPLCSSLRRRGGVWNAGDRKCVLAERPVRLPFRHTHTHADTGTHTHTDTNADKEIHTQTRGQA